MTSRFLGGEAAGHESIGWLLSARPCSVSRVHVGGQRVHAHVHAGYQRVHAGYQRVHAGCQFSRGVVWNLQHALYIRTDANRRETMPALYNCSYHQLDRSRSPKMHIALVLTATRAMDVIMLLPVPLAIGPRTQG